MNLSANATMSTWQSSFVPDLSSATSWALPASVALLAVLAVSEVIRIYVSPKSVSSGPRLYPFLGMLPELVKNQERMYDWLSDIIERSPNLTFSSFSPGLEEVYTANSANIQHILKDNFSNYPKGEVISAALVDLLGHGIFNSDGEQWKQQRKVASLEFSTNSLRKLIELSVHREIQERLFPVLDDAAATGASVDVQDVLLRFAFDNICQVGFGHHPGCLAKDFPAVPLITAFDNTSQAAMMRILLPGPVWRLMKLLNVGHERKMRDSIQLIHSFAGKIVQKRQEEFASKAKSGAEQAEPTDLLSRFMTFDEKLKGEGAVDNRYLIDVCTNFIGAGRETSSVALTWFFYVLTQHPEVEEKILEELKGIVSKRTSEEKEAPFSYEELREMSYMHASINETLRLHPTVPMDFRHALEEDVLPDGTPVPKGARVNYCIYAQGRSTQVWGEDAMEFKPERWLTPEGTVRNESPFKFSAFNAGPRICLGKDMAYIQMKCIASSVLRRYRISLAKGATPQYALAITVAMKGGLPIILRPRNV